MDRDQDINATYEGGVLRPDEPLALPERARVRVTVHDSVTAHTNGRGARIEPTPEQDRAGDEALARLAQRGVMTVGSPPTRDQLYDRL